MTKKIDLGLLEKRLEELRPIAEKHNLSYLMYIDAWTAYVLSHTVYMKDDFNYTVAAWHGIPIYYISQECGVARVMLMPSSYLKD